MIRVPQDPPARPQDDAGDAAQLAGAGEPDEQDQLGADGGPAAGDDPGDDDDPGVAGRPADPFPAEELDALAERPDSGRPAVHMAAIRALARAGKPGAHVRRKDLPADGGFTALIANGLIDQRGRLTEDGAGIARVLAEAPMRVRIHATAAKAPLIFEAHLFGVWALTLATPSPARFTGGGASADPGAANHVAIGMDDLGHLPVVMARWVGLRPPDPLLLLPAQREITASWEDVQAKFTGASTAPRSGGIWAQDWCGWAIETEPATATMTVVQAGRHAYRLTRPEPDVAQLTWIQPEQVWQDMIRIYRAALSR